MLFVIGASVDVSLWQWIAISLPILCLIASAPSNGTDSTPHSSRNRNNFRNGHNKLLCIHIRILHHTELEPHHWSIEQVAQGAG